MLALSQWGQIAPPVENIQESSWWAKRLAYWAGNIYGALVVLLIIGSFTVLIFSIETVNNFDTLANIARIVTSVIMLIFPLDLLRLSLSYHNYSKKAGAIERHAVRLLKNDAESLDEIQAIKLMNNYHLAHAEAPINPGWLWKLKRDDLNDLWDDYRRVNTEQSKNAT